MVVKKVGTKAEGPKSGRTAKGPAPPQNPIDVPDRGNAQDHKSKIQLLDDLQAMSDIGMTLRNEQQTNRLGFAPTSSDMLTDGFSKKNEGQKQQVLNNEDLRVTIEANMPKT